ncbi:MAG: Tim44/TimA family putative adaptor protein [Proteobacteria bacterium]|nr:Tim44/TimA family putative adaptor protein [Pseudomonadota bacterium]
MGSTLIEILIFAVLAIFLILRLGSVLGRRDGFEKPEGRVETTKPLVRTSIQETPAATSGEGVDAIITADKQFSEQAFLAGAEKAYRLILESFAKGDTKLLKPLLGYEMNISFGEAIRDRKKAEEDLKITLHDISRVRIVKAWVKDGIASIVTEIQSRQSRVVRNDKGDIIDGSETVTESFVDQWTFERDVISENPNWLLVEAETLSD